MREDPRSGADRIGCSSDPKTTLSTAIMPQFGAIIIGDEILCGKRQDKHMRQVIATLAERGLGLAWCQYLADDPALITATLRRTLATDDVVFSFGGIGATPDDHTRQCVAAAAGVALALHPDAEAEIRSRFGTDITPQRLMMGEFPAGSRIIPNPYNRIPGFSVHHHHFLPGFPQMAWPMMAWVLDNRYRELHAAGRNAECAIIVRGAGESQLIDLMNMCLAQFPGVKVFSLPHMSETERHIELGVRGDATQVAPAIEAIKVGVAALGFAWSEAG
jgi:molybdopterin-biosynthesis enzyme MoeA-like protein